MRHHVAYILILLALAMVSGCAAHDEWEWAAGRIYRQNPQGYVCRHRCALLGRDMIRAGKCFDLVFGEVIGSKNRHVRIEYWDYKGLHILEPTWSDSRLDRFIEVDRYMYVPTDPHRIQVIRCINLWLKEKGDTDYVSYNQEVDDDAYVV